ncbi:MAG: dephospho-CoA kinase [Actinomycetia bacterium]|nr:dephospho-CoA kinase [Actinomycetes bacterium]
MSHRVVGLTGGIGAGKSTAAAMLAELGAVIIDCDQLGRDVAAVGGSAYQPIIDRFGTALVGEGGAIDRAALGAIVFADAAELAALNAITHPAIDAEIAKDIAAAPSDATVILDMAVLAESQLGDGQYQHVLVIESPLADRIDRLARQRSMPADDAMARIDSQASDAERRELANDVIVNHGDLDDLRQQIESWWTKLNGNEATKR